MKKETKNVYRKIYSKYEFFCKYIFYFSFFLFRIPFCIIPLSFSLSVMCIYINSYQIPLKIL